MTVTRGMVKEEGKEVNCVKEKKPCVAKGAL